MPPVVATAAALAACAVTVTAAADDHTATIASLPLVARVVHVNVIGNGYELKPGDRLYADGAVLLARTGDRIGTVTFTCVVSGTHGGLGGSCTADLRLPLGRLTGPWPLVRSDGRRTRPITGGSGSYRSASGRFVLGPTRRNGDTPFTVELAP